jgi:hypothetical protein
MDPSPGGFIKCYIFNSTVSVYYLPLSNDTSSYIDHFSQGDYVRDRNSSRQSWDSDEEYVFSNEMLRRLVERSNMDIYMACYLSDCAAHWLSY